MLKLQVFLLFLCIALIAARLNTPRKLVYQPTDASCDGDAPETATAVPTDAPVTEAPPAYDDDSTDAPEVETAVPTEAPANDDDDDLTDAPVTEAPPAYDDDSTDAPEVETVVPTEAPANDDDDDLTDAPLTEAPPAYDDDSTDVPEVETATPDSEYESIVDDDIVIDDDYFPIDDDVSEVVDDVIVIDDDYFPIDDDVSEETTVAPVDDDSSCEHDVSEEATVAPVDDDSSCEHDASEEATVAPVDDDSSCENNFSEEATVAPVDDDSSCGDVSEEITVAPVDDDSSCEDDVSEEATVAPVDDDSSCGDVSEEATVAPVDDDSSCSHDVPTMTYPPTPYPSVVQEEETPSECSGDYGWIPVSVEGSGTYCAHGPQVCAGETQGNCPEVQAGLPYGSHCGRVASGVYGCKTTKETNSDYGTTQTDAPSRCSGEYGSIPVSVEGKDTYCTHGPNVCAGETEGNCPSAQPGLPNGSHCARVASGVYGCQSNNDNGHDEEKKQDKPDYTTNELAVNAAASTSVNVGLAVGACVGLVALVALVAIKRRRTAVPVSTPVGAESCI